MLRTFFDWLNLRDYERAKSEAQLAVVKRFARGNVTFQNGNILDEEGLDRLRAEGARALDFLRSVRDTSASDARLRGLQG